MRQWTGTNTDAVIAIAILAVLLNTADKHIVAWYPQVSRILLSLGYLAFLAIIYFARTKK